MTFDEWFEEYQPIKSNDGDSGLIIIAIKGLSLGDRSGSLPASESITRRVAGYGQKQTLGLGD